MDRLDEIRSFVRSAELGSFSAAGKVLRLPAQVVGKHVANLENSLGTQLLVRSTRAQRLTRVGDAFLRQCRIVLREAERAVAIVEDCRDGPIARLTIGAPLTFGTLRLVPFLATYLTITDGVTVRLALDDAPADLIKSGFDAVLRLGKLVDSGHKARRLGTFQLAAYASPAYVARRGLPAEPADLLAHDCVVVEYDVKPPLDNWVFERKGRRQTVKVSGRLIVDDGRAALEAARGGLGVVLQDTNVADPEVSAGRLVRLFPDHDGPSREVHVLYPGVRHPTPELTALVKALARDFNR